MCRLKEIQVGQGSYAKERGEDEGAESGLRLVGNW
jgi:hypothetical protein